MRSAIGLFAVAATATLAHADPKVPDAKSLADRAAFLDPIQVDSLTLTPIVATGKTDNDDLLVLDEAMPAKLVRITEFDEGDVNNLTLSNKSDKPVFLLAGEVIIGGKQDRIIGKNTIIPAKSTQQVPVFCVEHGRWNGETKEFATAKALAHGRLRGRANFEGQQDVWNEVAAKNEKHNTKSATDTYRRVAVQQSDGSNAGWQKKIDEAVGKLATGDRDRMIGYAVSLNGKIATVDVFGSPKLFKKLEKKLVSSYVTEAVDIVAQKDIKPPTATQVKEFVIDAEKAKQTTSYSTSDADTVMKKGVRASKSGVEYKGKAASPTAAPPAPKAVYETYHANE